jgi:hypothetical protein
LTYRVFYYFSNINIHKFITGLMAVLVYSVKPFRWLFHKLALSFLIRNWSKKLNSFGIFYNIHLENDVIILYYHTKYRLLQPEYLHYKMIIFKKNLTINIVSFYWVSNKKIGNFWAIINNCMIYYISVLHEKIVGDFLYKFYSQ